MSEQKDVAIKALEKLIMFYIEGGYKSSGLLTADTSFELCIKGPFGKKELVYLSNKLRSDAEHLSDGRINDFGSVSEFIEKLKNSCTSPHPHKQIEDMKP